MAQYKKIMRILITGGAGFIGSHLISKLMEQGHEPVILDNLSTGKLSNVPTGIEAYFKDCRDSESLKQASKGCEFIYHLASTVGVEKVLDNPRECIENIIESTHSVLSLGIPGIDFSTSEVYGKNTGLLTENGDLVYSGKARWSYATSKLIGEWLAKSAGWKTVRLFNIVGPNQNRGYVFSNFVYQAINDSPITVYDTGAQVRTFVDVRDTVSILASLKDKKFDVVNVGGVYTLSIREFANTVQTVLNSKSEIISVPYNKAYSKGFEDSFEDCPARIPDLTRLHSLVGDFKYLPFEKTIRDTAELMRRNQ
jgi:UDP-glucose 4-epimerase